MIYLDFAKAPHLRLLDKLSKHGIWKSLDMDQGMATWENAEGVYSRIQVFVEDDHKRSPHRRSQRGGLGGLGPPLELVQKKISIVNCAHTICSLTDITLFSFYLNKTDRLL